MAELTMFTSLLTEGDWGFLLTSNFATTTLSYLQQIYLLFQQFYINQNLQDVTKSKLNSVDFIQAKIQVVSIPDIARELRLEIMELFDQIMYCYSDKELCKALITLQKSTSSNIPILNRWLQCVRKKHKKTNYDWMLSPVNHLEDKIAKSNNCLECKKYFWLDLLYCMYEVELNLNQDPIVITQIWSVMDQLVISQNLDYKRINSLF